MPVLRNVMAAHGIGPVTLRDIDVLKLPHVLPVPPPFWLVATVFSMVGGGILLACLLLSALHFRCAWARSAGNTPRCRLVRAAGLPGVLRADMPCPPL